MNALEAIIQHSIGSVTTRMDKRDRRWAVIVISPLAAEATSPSRVRTQQADLVHVCVVDLFDDYCTGTRRT